MGYFLERAFKGLMSLRTQPGFAPPCQRTGENFANLSTLPTMPTMGQPRGQLRRR